MLTIFTPAYNRADRLHRVYESLLAQSNRDFEWLIIDDGSTDSTEQVVREFMKQKAIDIRYVKKGNGGKHTAHNLAIKLARGEYFFCVDSDDWLAENAVAEILGYVQDCKPRFVLAYKQKRSGKLLSSEFPKGVVQIDMLKLNEAYHCGGEFSMIFRTDFVRQFPFPVFEGERFMTEAVIYDRMAMTENVYLFPKVITVCEYQEDGLSNNLNSIIKNNPAGYCLYFMQRIDLQSTFLRRIVMAGKYRCFCRFAGKRKTLYTGQHGLLVAMCAPLGWAFGLYYKLARGF